MSEQAGRKPPTGLERLLWRAPIWLYRLHLGWLMGERFYCCTISAENRASHVKPYLK